MEQQKILSDNNIPRVLFKLSLPAVTGMLVMALYNVVDTIFVGRGAGSLAIAALSIVFPIQMIVMALGQLLGIGGGSIISRALGEKDLGKVQETTGTIFMTNIVLSLLLTVISLLIKQPLLKLFGASEAIYPFAKDYYEVIMLGTIFFVTGMSLNNLFRAEGFAKVAMLSMVIGAVGNIILDPIFIFVFEMGIRGAAIATIISQFASICYAGWFIASGRSILKVKFSEIKFRLSILREIFVIGMASFIRNIAGSLVFAIFNHSLAHYGGDIAIAAYGVIQRVLKFVTMPLVGIAQGLQPIAGYNYGAKKFTKLFEVNRTAFIWSFVIASLGLATVLLFSTGIMQVFSDDEQLIAMGSEGLRLMLALIPLGAFNIVATTIFQALGKALPSLVLSMSREILFLIPLILILPSQIGLKGIWLTMPLADMLSFILSLVLYIRLEKNLRSTKIAPVGCPAG